MFFIIWPHNKVKRVTILVKHVIKRPLAKFFVKSMYERVIKTDSSIYCAYDFSARLDN